MPEQINSNLGDIEEQIRDWKSLNQSSQRENKNFNEKQKSMRKLIEIIN